MNARMLFSLSVLKMLRLRGTYVPSMQVFPSTLVTVSQAERERKRGPRGGLSSHVTVTNPAAVPLGLWLSGGSLASLRISQLGWNTNSALTAGWWATRFHFLSSSMTLCVLQMPALSCVLSKSSENTSERHRSAWLFKERSIVFLTDDSIKTVHKKWDHFSESRASLPAITFLQLHVSDFNPSTQLYTLKS